MQIRDRYFSDNVFAVAAFRTRYAEKIRLLKAQLGVTYWTGKTVIDLGCGPGWFGRAFMEDGAHVVFVDARTEMLDEIKLDIPKASTLICDVEEEFSWIVMRAELVLCMGFLYHVANPAVLLRRIAEMTGRLVVDTTVMDHDGEAICWLKEPRDVMQNSIHGWGNRPSPGWVVAALHTAGFNEVRDISHPGMNAEPFEGGSGAIYDWDFRRTCGWRRGECTLRKMFLATK